MAFFDSRVSTFTIVDTGAQTRDITPYITRLEGLPGPRRLYPVTAIGDVGDKYHPSLYGATISLDLMWSNDALVGPDTIFKALRDHTAATAFVYLPGGAGKGQYSGNCWVEDYVIHTVVNTLLMATVTLKVDGAVNDS